MWGGKQIFAFIGGGAAGAAQLLTSAADIHVWTIPFRCRPIRLGFTVTTTVNGAATLRCDKRPTAGSDVGRGTGDVGTLTIPTTTAQGKSVYENTDFVAAGTGAWAEYLKEGQQAVVVIGSASAVAGQGIPWLLVEVDPEQPANNTAMSAG